MFKRNMNVSTVAEYVQQTVGNPDALLYPDPKPFIRNLDKAAEMIRAHHGPIAIIGDYDADGINASAILYKGLKRYGVEADIRVRLPKRFSEGYGLSESIVAETAAWMEAIAELGSGGLIITVDNGIAAHNAIEAARLKGIKVIVTDHHLGVRGQDGKLILPPADVVVDPNAEPEEGERSAYRDYCGAAIAYRLVCELCPEEDLTDLLVLASIATVTDVMTITSTNHKLVKDGLLAINAGRGPEGLRKIIRELKLDERHISEEDYGFKIGPVFNASSRLRDDGAKDVLNVLIDDSPSPEAVARLIKTNEDRKDFTKRSMEIAEMYVHANERPIVVYERTFGEGIIGLIAGKLCEKHQCPVIVFTKSKGGGLKGSGRSIPEVHLKDVLDRVAAKGLILKYGGHAQAAGLTIAPENLDAFRKAFAEECGPLPELKPEEVYDIEITPIEAARVLKEMQAYAPFGTGFPRPVFRMKVDVSPFSYRVIGQKGTSFLIRSIGCDLMGFDMVPRYEELGSPGKVDAIGDLVTDYFRGAPSNKLLVRALDRA